jgi:hypothetical protein
MKIPNTIAKHKILMNHKEIIIQKYHQGIPIKVIADDEKVYIETIYHLLRRWNIHKIIEEKEKEDYMEEIEPLVVLSFKKRVSQETFTRMRENTLINQDRIKYYPWPEDFFLSKKGFWKECEK